MFENLQDSIEIFGRKIQFNLDLLQKNESKINLILKEPVSIERTKKLKARFDYNKKILSENNDACKIQQSIIDYIEKYMSNLNDLFSGKDQKRNPVSNTESVNEFIELEKDDYLKLTIDGVMEFNKYHPYYNDEKFLNDLLKHYTSIENYEMCSFLFNLKKKISVL